MNLANFRTDRNGNPYGLKKCKYHCDYGDGEYCHYKEIDGCVHNKIKEEKDGKHRKVGEVGMPDRDKVMTGLELCTNISPDGCLMLCPYKDEKDETYPGFCEQVLKQDGNSIAMV